KLGMDNRHSYSGGVRDALPGARALARTRAVSRVTRYGCPFIWSGVCDFRELCGNNAYTTHRRIQFGRIPVVRRDEASQYFRNVYRHHDLLHGWLSVHAYETARTNRDFNLARGSAG